MTDEAPVQTNDQLVLISGESGTGKSASLMNLPKKEKWIFLNCEAGKRPPFRAKWYGGESRGTVITDPFEVYDAFDHGTNNPDVDGIILDTCTFLMEMFESVYINSSANTMKAWGDYAQFWKGLMQQKVASFNKPVIILGHTKEKLDEAAGIMRRSVPVKGSLANNGLEAYFSTVVSTKRVDMKALKDYGSKLLTITDEEQELGYKHVFQTRPTKATIGERIRSPLGLFSPAETFMDNDAQLLLNHLNTYYK